MKLLYELSNLSNKQKKLVRALLPSNANLPINKLYNLLLSENELTNYESMIHIYGKSNLTSFSALKKRTLEVLTKVIVCQFGILGDESAWNREKINCYRHTLASRILLYNRLRVPAIDLLEKSIALSIKHCFTDIILVQSQLLIEHYGNSEYNKYKLRKYIKIEQKYLKFYQAEIIAHNYFIDLQRIQMSSLANINSEIICKTENIIKELSRFNDIESPTFRFNKFRVESSLYEFKKEYNALLTLCNNTLKQFTLNSEIIPISRVAIILRKFWALIQSGQYKQCIKLGLIEFEKMKTGSLAWHLIGIYTIKALIYNKEYNTAYTLVIQLKTHPSFKKIGQNYKELIDTNHGYVYLVLNSSDPTRQGKKQKHLDEFKLGKYLNTTPIFSKDKRGINVSILLLHIAFLLQRKDYNTIIDRVDSLNRYAGRYLRRDDTFRSNCMIKMIVQMTKADFHPIKTERYTSDLRKQLDQVSIAGSGGNIDVEVIPFEVLWEIMLKSL